MKMKEENAFFLGYPAFEDRDVRSRAGRTHDMNKRKEQDM